MMLDDGFILPQRLADLQVLPLRGPLNAIDIEVLGASEAHQQIVVQAKKEPRSTWIALPPRAPAELIVDAPGLMARRADDVHPPHFYSPFAIYRGFPPQQNVSPSPRHVGR